MKPGRTVWVAVALVALVIAASGLTGTVHFGGPRFYPHLNETSNAPLVRPHTLGSQGRAPILPTARGSNRVPLIVAILIGLVIAIALFVVLRRLWNRRRSPAPISRNAPRLQDMVVVSHPVDPGVDARLLTGIEAALRALDEPREPRDAIVRAWLGLEETAQQSGVIRRPSETPTEFTSRALEGAFADDRAIATMLRLYLRTRFGDHPPSAADVVAVRAALQHLVTEQRSSRAVVTPAAR